MVFFGHLDDEPEKNGRCPVFVNVTLSIVVSYGFGSLFVLCSSYRVMVVLLSTVITLFDNVFGCLLHIVRLHSHTPSWKVMHRFPQ